MYAAVRSEYLVTNIDTDATLQVPLPQQLRLLVLKTGLLRYVLPQLLCILQRGLPRTIEHIVLVVEDLGADLECFKEVLRPFVTPQRCPALRRVYLYEQMLHARIMLEHDLVKCAPFLHSTGIFEHAKEPGDFIRARLEELEVEALRTESVSVLLPE